MLFLRLNSTPCDLYLFIYLLGETHSGKLSSHAQSVCPSIHRMSTPIYAYYGIIFNISIVRRRSPLMFTFFLVYLFVTFLLLTLYWRNNNYDSLAMAQPTQVKWVWPWQTRWQLGKLSSKNKPKMMSKDFSRVTRR